jgi:hypothetical protein
VPGGTDFAHAECVQVEGDSDCESVTGCCDLRSVSESDEGSND